ncbi:MAG: hypothetical protein R2714_17455 [Microthrixaceae bacterium]
MTPEIWAALLVGVIGPTIVALIGLREVKRRVGTPNGQGNVIEMLERILHGQTGQDSRLAQIEVRLNRGDQRFTEIEGRLVKIESPEEAA